MLSLWERVRGTFSFSTTWWLLAVQIRDGHRPDHRPNFFMDWAPGHGPWAQTLQFYEHGPPCQHKNALTRLQHARQIMMIKMTVWVTWLDYLDMLHQPKGGASVAQHLCSDWTLGLGNMYIRLYCTCQSWHQFVHQKYKCLAGYMDCVNTINKLAYSTNLHRYVCELLVLSTFTLKSRIIAQAVALPATTLPGSS